MEVPCRHVSTRPKRFIPRDRDNSRLGAISGSSRTLEVARPAPQARHGERRNSRPRPLRRSRSDTRNDPTLGMSSQTRHRESDTTLSHIRRHPEVAQPQPRPRARHREWRDPRPYPCWSPVRMRTSLTIPGPRMADSRSSSLPWRYESCVAHAAESATTCSVPSSSSRRGWQCPATAGVAPLRRDAAVSTAPSPEAFDRGS